MRTGKLTALAVRRAIEPGRYGDGGNLHLVVRANGSRAWVLRYQLPGRKQRDMGLGREPDISLARARELAREARTLILAGADPIETRREAAAAAIGHGRTFREVALEYVASHEAGWKNPVHRRQWRTTLETYAFPVMGDVPVAAVELRHVQSVLQPIWIGKPETASRLRGRIENILSSAKVQGWRTGENPARWKENLDRLLPARASVSRVEHHPAMPWRDCPAFVRELEECEGAGASALRFTMLTAVRTSEAILATWREIDLGARKWTIPAPRMKAEVEHEVPLSSSALDILRSLHHPGVAADDFVFPGGKLGRPLSNNAMLAVLRRFGLTGDVTVHGFRSSFRDWGSEATHHSSEALEAALAHTVRDKVEAAYRRTKLFKLRVKLMADWDAFLSGREPKVGRDPASA